MIDGYTNGLAYDIYVRLVVQWISEGKRDWGSNLAPEDLAEMALECAEAFITEMRKK